jgi:hypothetical protein
MEAREHGVPIDEAAARRHFVKYFRHLTDLDKHAQGYDGTDSALSEAYSMVAAQAAGLAPNTATAALARMIATRQTKDGRWRTLDYRPPQTGSPFTTTALAIRALQVYMPRELEGETTKRVSSAAEWLKANTPADTESHVYRVLGLHWAAASPTSITSAARELLAGQRPDGGWAQISRRGSDAYATGQALFALHSAGMLAVTDEAFQRGTRYLLQTQSPDGSWHVVSRIHDGAPVSPPFFETGFPHGKDQFTSMSGTNWAIRALSLTLPRMETGGMTLPEIAPTEPEPWVRTALFGTAAQLGEALKAGMSPNARTAGGTSAIMLAAADPEKVSILLDAGADANAPATKTGCTPLMVAAAYGGTTDTVRKLIERGAQVANPTRKKPINNISALLNAVIAGERETVSLLIANGADINQKSIAFTTFTVWPLVMATLYADEEIAFDLLQHGAKVNVADPTGATAMFQAALSGHASLVRLLAKHGARVNDYDNFGMTPLLWAFVALLFRKPRSTVTHRLSTFCNPHCREAPKQRAGNGDRNYSRFEYSPSLSSNSCPISERAQRLASGAKPMVGCEVRVA